MFDIFRVTEVTDNNLVQLETLDGKPSKTRTPYASVKPVRRSMLIELLKSRLYWEVIMKLFDKVLLSPLGSQAAWPTKETVSNLSETESADSELEEDPLEVNISVSLNFTQ